MFFFIVVINTIGEYYNLGEGISMEVIKHFAIGI
jgi:hypothetical protein